MPFKKGQSGNPSGRHSTGQRVMDEIDKVLQGRGKNKRALIHDIIERWGHIAAYAEKDRDALDAGDKLLTRILGSPTQRIEGHVSTEASITHVFVEALREHNARIIEGTSNNIAQTDENIATMLPAPAIPELDS